MKARSGTKAVVISILYATDKRGARCAQILIDLTKNPSCDPTLAAH